MRNPLGLVYRWLCRAMKFLCISGHVQFLHTILALQSGKEEEQPSANFQLGKKQMKKWCVNLVVTKWEIFNGHLQTNIGLKLKQNQTAKSEV